MNKEKCATCALRVHEGQTCGLTGLPAADTDFCSKYQKTLELCEICGGPIVGKPIIVPDGDKFHLVCGKCAKDLTGCSTCNQRNYCDFDTNPSPIPKTVRRVFQKGPMQTVTEVMNPERIRETCEKNCHCFDAEFGCWKQLGFCTKQEIEWK